MFTSCLNKQAQIKALFASCVDTEAKYQRIIDLGRTQASLTIADKIPENIVHGCQSRVYLKTWLEGNKVFFETEADALISAGLAMLLTKVYSGETAETILKCPPIYLEEIGISQFLTPSRANGLYHIHLRMKQEAVKTLTS